MKIAVTTEIKNKPAPAASTTAATIPAATKTWTAISPNL